MNTADVVVIGLGAAGSAALYQLARRGARAVGIDRFRPPHDLGSSHGETRITRQAIGEGLAYVPLVLRSHQIWRELEAQTGQELFVACGGLILGGQVGETSHHGKPEFLRRTVQAAEHFGIEHELLGADEVAARFPQFGLEGDEHGYYEPGAGFLRPERCVAAQLAEARRLGAGVRLGERVTRLETLPDGVRVHTDRGTLDAAQAVVSAGPWAAELLGGPLGRALGVYRQVLFWFEAERPEDYAPGRFPIFIWMHGPGDGGHFYGFPQVSQGVKVAGEQSLVTTRPDEVDRGVSGDEVAGMHRQHIGGRLKGLTPKLVRAATCLYTSTPDGDFALGRHPERERVWVASPCSGHGFKHSAAVGEALAELALEGRTRFDLGAFDPGRFSA